MLNELYIVGATKVFLNAAHGVALDLITADALVVTRMITGSESGIKSRRKEVGWGRKENGIEISGLVL